MQNKTPSNVTLNKNWFWRIPTIAVILSLLLIIGLRGIPFVVSSVCNNVHGWDGLGCFFIGLYIGRVIVGMPLIILSIALLKRFVTDSRRLAILITLPLTAFVVASVLTNGLDYVTPDFPVNISGYVLLLMIGTIFISLLMLLAILLFRYTDRVNKAVSLIICLVLIPIIYSTTQFASTSLRSSLYVHGQKNELKDLSFQVYQPSYVPNGYSLTTGIGGPGLQPGVSLLRSAGERELFVPTYYDFWYYPAFTFGGDVNQPKEYTLYEYEASSDYSPPQDCGGTVSIISAGGSTFPELDAYGDKTRPCDLIGSSNAGCDVYYEEHSLGFDVTGLFGYCKVGSTVIALAGRKPFTNHQDTAAQKAEIIKIFDSLKQLTPQQLENYALEKSKNRT